MGRIENRWRQSWTRRSALQAWAGFLAGSPLLHGQQDPFRDHSRVPGLDELLNTFDFENAFHNKVSREIYDYTTYGDESEFTVRRNREAFDWIQLVPRAVADVRSVKTETEILGTKMPYPIMTGASSGHALVHPEGEAATHRGTTAASNTTMVVSGVASQAIDEIAKAATGPLWYQLYARQDLDATRELLENAQAAGCRAVAWTVDQQASTFERWSHDRNFGGRPAGAGRRGGARAANPASNPYRVQDSKFWYEWKFIDRIRPLVKAPLLAKGILTPEDARICVEHGLDGILVSNHGGRSLDYDPSTIEVLPEIVDAVGGRIPVLIDSGFRRGTDILKALALGAKGVCLGRTIRWGLGSFGAPGVQRVLEVLQAELVLAMASTGCPTLASIDRSIVRTDFP